MKSHTEIIAEIIVLILMTFYNLNFEGYYIALIEAICEYPHIYNLKYAGNNIKIKQIKNEIHQDIIMLSKKKKFKNILKELIEYHEQGTFETLLPFLPNNIATFFHPVMQDYLEGNLTQAENPNLNGLIVEGHRLDLNVKPPGDGDDKPDLNIESLDEEDAMFKLLFDKRSDDESYSSEKPVQLIKPKRPRKSIKPFIPKETNQQNCYNFESQLSTYKIPNITMALNPLSNKMAKRILNIGMVNNALVTNSYENIDLGVKLLGHIKEVFNVRYDHFGHRLITGADDRNIKIWDLKTGFLIFTLKGHFAAISDMKIMKNRNLLISCDIHGYVIVWNLSNGTILAKKCLFLGLEVTSVFFLSYNYDSQLQICASSKSGSFYLFTFKEKDFEFDIERTFISEGFAYKNKPLLAGAINSTGTMLAFGGGDYMIKIYMPKLLSDQKKILKAARKNRHGCLKWDSPRLTKVLHGHTDSVNSLDFNKDGTRLLSSANDQSARVWNYDSDTQEWTSIVLGKGIDILNDDGRIRDLKKGFKVKEHDPIDFNEIVCDLIWANDDKNIVVTYYSGLIRVFCSFTGIVIHELRWIKDRIHVIHSNPKATNIILVASYDGDVCIFDCAKGVILKNWKYKEEIFLAGEFSPDGLGFSLGSDLGNVYVYEQQLGNGYKAYIMKDKFQALSSDFVNVPNIVSFPTPGTITNRNSFKEYSLRDLDNNKYEHPFLQPDDFGKEYTDKQYFVESEVDHELRQLRLEHYKWSALKWEEFELPNKYYYQRFKKAHDTKVPEEVLAVLNEPIEAPPSPKDPDFILEEGDHQVNPSDDLIESDLGEEELNELVASSSSNSNKINYEIEEETDDEIYQPNNRLSTDKRKNKKVNRRRKNIKRESILSNSRRYDLRSKREAKDRRNQYNKDTEVSENEDNSADYESTINDENSVNEPNLVKLDEHPLNVINSNNPEYLKLLKNDPKYYFPQVGEEIVYLRSGHEEFLDSLDSTKKKHFSSKTVPFIKYPNLSYNEVGIVENINYKLTDNIIITIIKIKLDKYKVSVLIDENFPRFIINKNMFDYTNNHLNYNVNDLVYNLKDNNNESMKVEYINNDNIEDPWNQIICNDGNKYGKWELNLYESEFKFKLTELEDDLIKKYINILQSIIEDEKYATFINAVDFNDYPTYYKIIINPIFLSLIYTRLINKYYVSEDSILHDIIQIKLNAKLFNKPHSYIVKVANELEDLFKELKLKNIQLNQLDEDLKSEIDEQEEEEINNNKTGIIFHSNSNSQLNDEEHSEVESNVSSVIISKRKRRKWAKYETDESFNLSNEESTNTSDSENDDDDVDDDVLNHNKSKNKSLKNFIVGEIEDEDDNSYKGSNDDDDDDDDDYNLIKLRRNNGTRNIRNSFIVEGSDVEYYNRSNLRRNNNIRNRRSLIIEDSENSDKDDIVPEEDSNNNDEDDCEMETDEL